MASEVFKVCQIKFKHPVQYTQAVRMHQGSKNYRELLISISMTSLVYQNFQIGPCAGPQKPEKLSLPKIKYEKFRPKATILHWKMSVRIVDLRTVANSGPFVSTQIFCVFFFIWRLNYQITLVLLIKKQYWLYCLPQKQWIYVYFYFIAISRKRPFPFAYRRTSLEKEGTLYPISFFVITS